MKSTTTRPYEMAVFCPHCNQYQFEPMDVKDLQGILECGDCKKEYIIKSEIKIEEKVILLKDKIVGFKKIVNTGEKHKMFQDGAIVALEMVEKMIDEVFSEEDGDGE